MNLEQVRRMMLPEMLVVVLLASLSATGVLGNPDPVDVALNKQISVSKLATCGTAVNGNEVAEYFYGLSQIDVRPRSRVTCRGTNAYPPGAMVDGKADTYWLSKTRNFIFQNVDNKNSETVRIEIDLKQELSIERIEIHMGDTARPLRMKIFKTEKVLPIDWKPWIYRVTDEADCKNVYGISNPIKIPTGENTPICSKYPESNRDPRTGQIKANEKIIFDMKDVPKAHSLWKNTRHIRIFLDKMELVLSTSSFMFHRYAIRDLKVFADCACNGHNTGCTKSNVTGQYTCVCGDNTEGDICQRCKPFYNQLKFSNAYPCESCNCNLHTTSCYYNATVDRLNMSTNAKGEKKGGGTCLNCQNKTTGVNCEKCIPLHFRPLDKKQSDKDACQPCNCSGSGLGKNPTTSAVNDCIMNNDTALSSGKKPGDCYCKEFVTGEKCDRCKNGYYKLDPKNPKGCTACECDVRGTLNGSSVCHPNGTGVCPCKKYVTGRQCNQCMDGYYGLNTNNTEGCSPCECDVGGASSKVCNKLTGQCTCRRNIEGRKCDKPKTGFFFPTVHYLRKDVEDYDWENRTWARQEPGYQGGGYQIMKKGSSASVSITIPSPTQLGDQFYPLPGYRAAAQVTATLDVLSSIGKRRVENITFPACPTGWCFPTVPSFSLTPGTTTVKLTTDGDLLLDTVTLMPKVLIDNTTVTTVLGANAAKYLANCEISGRDMKTYLKPANLNDSFCMSSGFSLQAYYHNGAISCDCHLQGSNKTTCAVYGGKCTCRAGVGGRRCDQCLPEYHSLTTSGCSLCNCKADQKVCNRGNGQCRCPPHVVNRDCGSCAQYSYNYNPTTGCTACACDSRGSTNLQCNTTTGVCSCKLGIYGTKCNRCQDGYKLFSILGCTSCGCNMAGSTSSICNQTSGQCPCKGNAEGKSCSECKAGTFLYSQENPQGCLDCVCMGVSKLCSSTGWGNVQITVPLLTGTGTNKTAALKLETEVGNKTNPISSHKVNNVDSLQATVNGAENIYWVDYARLRGNLLGIYGNTLEFKVHFTAATGVPRVPRCVIVGHKNAKFIFELPKVNVSQTTTLKVTFREELLSTSAMGKNVTRGQFLLGLSDVQKVMLPAVFYDKTQLTSIGDIKYTIASQQASPFGIRSKAVEQCSCPAGYSGLSCEKCLTGYKRANVTTQGYLGRCVKCECNSHSTACDQTTGVCQNCQYHTTGPSCETCMNGYYGDATKGTPNDCRECPCFSPRVVNNTCAFNGSSIQCNCNPGYTSNLCEKCDKFYYGNPVEKYTGKCQKCDCNNNAQTCDASNGTCLNCANNSTGEHCERCKDGFYGNATIQDCKPCDCHVNGSMKTVCNYTTGQCDCQPGVTNRTCDRCLPNYYGFENTTSKGCVVCNCSTYGSSSAQCEPQNGKCSCKANVAGFKCERCSAGWWGLPNQACTKCACNSTGSVPGTSPECEYVSGQCKCKTGIAGRQCDKCDRLYVDFSATGCKKCDRCQFSLGNDTLLLKQTFARYWNETSHVGKLEDEDRQLQGVQGELNATLAKLGASEQTLDVLSGMVRNMTALQPTYNKTLTDLSVGSSEKLMDTCQKMENSSAQALTRIQSLQTAAHGAYNLSVKQAPAAEGIITTLTSYNTSAYALKSQGSNVAYSGLKTNFTDELVRAKATDAAVNDTKALADQVQSLTKKQSSDINQLRTETQAVKNQLTSLMQSSRNAQIYSANVFLKKKPVEELVNKTLNNKAFAESLFSDTKSLLNQTKFIISTSNANFNQGTQDFTDCTTIINGGKSPLPISNTSVDVSGLKSWNSGALLLETALNKTKGTVGKNASEVIAAEKQAQNLTNQAKAINDEYKYAEAKGKRAVDAISNYVSVAQTLNQSTLIAQAANKTLTTALKGLSAIGVRDLENQANISRKSSEDLLKAVTAYNLDGPDLSTKLDTANASFSKSVSQWAAVDKEIAAFNSKVSSLTSVAANPGINEQLSAGTASANAASALGKKTVADDNALAPGIATQSAQVSVVETSVTKATQLMTQTAYELSKYNDGMNAVQQRVNQLNSSYRTTNLTRISLDARMADLEAKLKKALELGGKLEQPVNMNGLMSSQFDVPQGANKAMLYNIIELRFSPAAAGSNGLLLFVEDPSKATELSLELVKGVMYFEFNLGSESVRIMSIAEICSGCWFLLQASRYGNVGHLTLKKISTGGSTTQSGQAKNSDNTLTVTSKVMVAGLPTTSNTTKVTKSKFKGCLYDVRMDSVVLPIFRYQLMNGATCCQKPTSPSPQPLDPGTSFDGFGFLRLQPSGFEVSVKSQVSFKFRTFSKNAVMLLVDKTGTDDYYGLFLMGGFVRFQFKSGSTVKTLSSTKSYNDGEWYQLTALMNSTYSSLVLYKMSGSAATLSETLTAKLTNFNINSLKNGFLTVGAQNPDTTTNVGPTTHKFAGCLSDFKQSIGSVDNTLRARNLNTYIINSKFVFFAGCLPMVVSGMGFRTAKAYGSFNIPTLLRSVASVEVEFSTTELNGILAYARDVRDPDIYFYIALLNGNAFVTYGKGPSSIGQAILSTVKHLNDGFKHIIKADFTGVGSEIYPRMIVDGTTYVGKKPLGSANIAMLGRGVRMYVGGVHNQSQLRSDMPVHASLIGSIHQLKISGTPVDYFNPLVLDQQNEIYLSGCKPVPTTIPPPPYSTTVAPPTTPKPTCASFTKSQLQTTGAFFKEKSYMYNSLTDSQWTTIFKSTFVLTLEFRAVSANGLLMYAASTASNPNNWFALYLENGYIVFSMKSSTNNPKTLRILSKYTYNTGNKTKVNVLRINDFIAVVVPKVGDYANNKMDSLSKSDLQLHGNLYIGGVDIAVIKGKPFTDFKIGQTSFQGCIETLEVGTHSQNDLYQPYKPDLKSPKGQSGVTACYSELKPGRSLEGNGYIIESALDKSKWNTTAYSVSIVFRTTRRDGLLFTHYLNQETFVVIDIKSGIVRATFSNQGNFRNPFTVTADTSLLPNSYAICDNQKHTVSVSLYSATDTPTVKLSIDGKDRAPLSIPAGYSPPTLDRLKSQIIWLGGLRDDMAFPFDIVRLGFHGCIESAKVNEVDTGPTLTSTNMGTGCFL